MSPEPGVPGSPGHEGLFDTYPSDGGCVPWSDESSSSTARHDPRSYNIG